MAIQALNFRQVSFLSSEWQGVAFCLCVPYLAFAGTKNGWQASKEDGDHQQCYRKKGRKAPHWSRRPPNLPRGLALAMYGRESATLLWCSGETKEGEREREREREMPELWARPFFSPPLFSINDDKYPQKC